MDRERICHAWSSLAYSPAPLLAELEMLFLQDVLSIQCSPRCTGAIGSAADTKHIPAVTQNTDMELHQTMILLSLWACVVLHAVA